MSFFKPPLRTTTTLGNGAMDAADVELDHPPSDSISCVAFSPATQGEYLAVGSWDNTVHTFRLKYHHSNHPPYFLKQKVRIYALNPATAKMAPLAMYEHRGPVLDLCWNTAGDKLFSAGVDNAVRMFEMVNLQTAQTVMSRQVGAHDDAVRCVKWIEAPTGGILASGSWDKSVKYWDLNSPQPIGSFATAERVYAMDVAYPLLVVATAERHIHIVNLTNPLTIYKTVKSPLKQQTRSVGCFGNGDGFAVGSIEGRLAIQYVAEKDTAKNYSFKCHRREQSPTQKDQSLVYAVNAVTFHKQCGTFATAGGDGCVSIWDGESKTRLKNFEAQPGPITTLSFNASGTILAYAVSYDWYKGHSGMVNGHVNKVMLHWCKDEEVKKKTRR